MLLARRCAGFGLLLMLLAAVFEIVCWGSADGGCAEALSVADTDVDNSGAAALLLAVCVGVVSVAVADMVVVSRVMSLFMSAALPLLIPATAPSAAAAATAAGGAAAAAVIDGLGSTAKGSYSAILLQLLH